LLAAFSLALPPGGRDAALTTRKRARRRLTRTSTANTIPAPPSQCPKSHKPTRHRHVAPYVNKDAHRQPATLRAQEPVLQSLVRAEHLVRPQVHAGPALHRLPADLLLARLLHRAPVRPGVCCLMSWEGDGRRERGTSGPSTLFLSLTNADSNADTGTDLPTLRPPSITTPRSPSAGPRRSPTSRSKPAKVREKGEAASKKAAAEALSSRGCFGARRSLLWPVGGPAVARVLQRDMPAGSALTARARARAIKPHKALPPPPTRLARARPRSQNKRRKHAHPSIPNNTNTQQQAASPRPRPSTSRPSRPRSCPTAAPQAARPRS